MMDVTCALIRNDEGLVLAVRRGPLMDNAGKWEFPGGKTRPGEDHEECIVREIDEELGINIIITGRLDQSEYDYGDKHIRLIPFLCETLSSRPHLREHDEYRWMLADELLKLDLTAADIPIAKQYAENNQAGVVITQTAPEVVETVEAGEELARLLGRITSVEEITMVAHAAETDTILLSQLVALSSSHEKRVGFMASWGLSKVADVNTEVLMPFLPAIADALPFLANESVLRSFMRIITKCDVSQIPVSYHAPMIEFCLGVMRSTNTAIAPKAYGMDILASFCLLYPDMVNEVTLAIQMVMSQASAGVKAMGHKALSRLKEKG